MQTFLDEILQQSQALQDCFAGNDDDVIQAVRQVLHGRPVLMTGMGASFHAGEIIAYRVQARQPVRVHQAVDLLNYPAAALDPDTVVVYVSQSGDSAEVVPLLDQLDGRHTVIALTNNPDSALGRRADLTLALHAGSETTVATKTYLNTLVLLHRIAGASRADLDPCAESIAALLAHADEITLHWRALFDNHAQLYFLGHGAHGVTARHVSMMLAEWCKRPSVGMSIGAFRHGFIETIDPAAGVVIFAPHGRTRASALALAAEIAGYGAQVLIVEHGHTRHLQDDAAANGDDAALRDELLAPLIDIIPAQLAVAAAASAAGNAGFRYIRKVVTRL